MKQEVRRGRKFVEYHDPETGTLINLSKYQNKVYRIVSYRKVA